MTLVQLEYIVAVDSFRHFATAADRCYVTQPTLSMQIQKLEDELGVLIFDRSKQPVVPTELGAEIIIQARKVLQEKDRVLDFIQEQKGILSGELKLGIIPTLAPYLIPLFVSDFHKKYPLVKLIVNELMTDHILLHLKEGRLDAAILATPLLEKGLKEHLLFYEEFVVFASPKNKLYQKNRIELVDVKSSELWLMKEGNCFRSQVINFCELNETCSTSLPFEYEAGSIETLRKLVISENGVTILPELSTMDMRKNEEKMVRRFNGPIPVREVSLVVHRGFIKKRIVDALKLVIIQSLPEKIKSNSNDFVVPM